MTPHDVSQDSSEVTKPMLFPTTRATLFIGTWNVRTMWKSGKTSQTAVEMRKYKLTVLATSETH